MKLLQVTLLLFLFYNSANCYIQAVMAIITMGMKVGDMVYSHIKDKELFEKIDNTTRKIGEIESKLDNYGLDQFFSAMYNIPEEIRLELKTNELQKYFSTINEAFDHMNHYTKKDYSFIEQVTLEDFAFSVISHGSLSLRSILSRLQDFLVPIKIGVGENNLLKIINDRKGGLCKVGSQQQVIMNLYNSISVAQLKGYVMIKFSYMILKNLQKGNFSRELELTDQQFKKRIQDSLSAVKKALRYASRKVWICDPKKYNEGENYIQITNFLQGYLQNEVDLNGEGTCKENCAHYSYTKSHGCYQELYCRKQRRCTGRIHDCRYVSGDAEVCLTQGTNGRRYDYVQYGNGITYGKKTSNCTYGSFDSWYRWIFWHCSYCMCICDEPSTKSDRYFNLRPTVSDIKNNKIVIGMRFVKNNRVIHIQIQEGMLLENGSVDADTLNWVPVDNYKIYDRMVFSGIDFHTLSHAKRALHLEKIEGRSNELLTGIRFQMSDSLHLEIRLTPFDFVSGKLYPDKSYWKDNDEIGTSDNRVNLNDLDIPSRATTHSVLNSVDNGFLEFTHTGYKQDVAQTAIPFIDTQPVQTLYPIPLSGVGIYHKSQTGYGGFIGLNIFTYDMNIDS